MSARTHFSIAGIPIHVQPVFFVISGLFGLRYADIDLNLVFIWMACTFVSILVHELGHGLSLKAFGQPSAIVLHGFGGVTLSQRRLPRARSVVVSLAGSLTALAVLWWPARTAFASDWIVDQHRYVIWAVYFLAFQNLWWSVANLLPIRPLDGGNVTAELFGLPQARRISIGVAIAAGLYAFSQGQTYAGLFALFLAFNNFREIREEQSGHDVDAFQVEPPESGGAPPQGRPRRRRSHLQPVAPPVEATGPLGTPALGAEDPARLEQMAWSALRSGNADTARRLVARAGAATVSPYLTATVALASGDAEAFEAFEAAYVAQPGGPPSLVATDLLARAGAAAAVARRLVARPDGRGREGAATLQTHLHYADRYQEAAEVGEAVYEAGPPSPAQTAFEVACSWSRAGEVDRSVEWLEKAAEHGFRAASIVDGEPDLTPVRDDPRWPLLRIRLS